jgi:RNA polymerase sigma-70 factor (family 1)
MPSGSDNDEEIIARVRQHDEGALRRLLRKYQRPLGSFSYAILRSRDLADEAVSNVFLNIWRRRERLAIKTTVRSYLFAATGNQSINLWKEKKKHAGVHLSDAHARRLVDPRRTESEVLYRELRAEIDTLLSRLPPQRQRVFRLNRLEGLSYWQIAADLGLSEHTVQNHMTQAMRQLAQEWPRLRAALDRKAAPEAPRPPAPRKRRG